MNSSCRKILLVEDMEINKVLMRKLLSGLDVELQEVQNGEMAVDYFEKGNTCDLIFMDKDMPIMDGHEATRLLRSLGVRTPIIALSASNLQTDKDLFFQAGANEYQTKLSASYSIPLIIPERLWREYMSLSCQIGEESEEMMVGEASSSYSWSWEEEKAFENALAVYTEDGVDRWEKIAADLPMKTLEEIMHHYKLLEEDVCAIESGLIPLPSYPCLKTRIDSGNDGGNGHERSKASRLEQERRKGIAWSEEEHRLFLVGLEKYGKGDWRSISRNFVVTRTPTQVASHAQKFFIRLNSGNKDRRRSSIHDITTVGQEDDPVTPQKKAAISKPGHSGNQSVDQLAERPGVGLHETDIEHPVVAIGTLVTKPVPGTPQMVYGVQTPVTSETVVPKDPVNFPLRSRMPRKSAHR